MVSRAFFAFMGRGVSRIKKKCGDLLLSSALLTDQNPDEAYWGLFVPKSCR